MEKPILRQRQAEGPHWKVLRTHSPKGMPCVTALGAAFWVEGGFVGCYGLDMFKFLGPWCGEVGADGIFQRWNLERGPYINWKMAFKDIMRPWSASGYPF